MSESGRESIDEYLNEWHVLQGVGCRLQQQCCRHSFRYLTPAYLDASQRFCCYELEAFSVLSSLIWFAILLGFQTWDSCSLRVLRAMSIPSCTNTVTGYAYFMPWGCSCSVFFYFLWPNICLGNRFFGTIAIVRVRGNPLVFMDEELFLRFYKPCG